MVPKAMKLTSYIKEDLLLRIQSEHAIPHPLTIAHLSEHYGVSYTPVKTAVAELIQEGWLFRKSTRGRLEINKQKTGSRTRKRVIHCPRSPEDWDRVLLIDVALASLNRAASYLREEPLAQKHNIGRSVLRQAFHRFAGAGLIEHVPRCGWLVHPLGHEDVKAYLELREIMELKALDLARPHLARPDLELMLAENRTASQKGAGRLNNCIHGYLVENSGNRYIRDFFHQPVSLYYTTLFDYAAPKASVVSEMAKQHCRILEQLMARSWARARQTLAEHIQAQAHVLNKLSTGP
jgi:DNA-binding GntR family transcriptional regulator